MVRACVACLIYTLAVVLVLHIQASYVELQLNPHSTMFRDVAAVAHNITHNQVIVKLKHSRRCDKPTFVVRMSGTALYLMRMEKRLRHAVIFSYPPVVDTGQYFIEVTALYCRGFNPEAYVGKCIEPPYYGKNIITLPYSINLQGSGNTESKRPRWIRQNHSIIAPLSTRYQMRIEEKAPGEVCTPDFFKTHCQPDLTEMTVHQTYKWVDGPSYSDSLQTLLRLSDAAYTSADHTTIADTMNRVITICFVGDSHARDLLRYGDLLPEPLVRVEMVRLSSYFPQMFNTSQLDEHLCSIAVVSYGQWPLSANVPRQWNRTRYGSEMRRMMESTLPPQYAGGTKVFIRSENYNGLGSYQAHCPPRDHRSMPVIDMANHVAQQLAQELRLDYIDLNHIIGPLWDSAPDFCHPPSQVYGAELGWILYTAFTTLVGRNEAVRLHDRQAVRVQNPQGCNDLPEMMNLKEVTKMYA